MKIGIITFHRPKNYGAELQAYAMQTFLQEHGHDAYLVDYWPKYREETEKLLSLKLLKGVSWKRKLQLIFQAPLIRRRFIKRWRSTARFVKTYLHLSNDKEFDVVIYGSDQIWRKMNNPMFKGYDPVYFGNDYVSAKKKVSYAASMGRVAFANNTDEKQFLELLRNFDAISVRETDLKNYLDDKIEKDIPIVCDPVFLLNEKSWKKFVDTSVIPESPYIFYYNHQELSLTTDFADYLSKHTGMPVIEMRGQITPFHYSKRYRLTADAREFVSLLSGASIVVTSSFHGVALSVCLGKQFYYASHSSRANRIESLLNTLELDGRKIEKNFEQMQQGNLIDYNIIWEKKNSIVQSSKLWLLSQLDINNE